MPWSLEDFPKQALHEWLPVLQHEWAPASRLLR
jgi:hypothetical protein